MRHPALNQYITPAALNQLIDTARREDVGERGVDVTSRYLVPAATMATARLVAREAGRLAGAAIVPAVVKRYDRRVRVKLQRRDGDALRRGDTVATLTGPLRSILAIERVALNFCTHLSGIATLTARYVRETAGTRAKIYDTRKTHTGLRALEKYAVMCGGGHNHRLGLHDAMLVKDNHIAHIPLPQLATALRRAIHAARASSHPPAFVQVEVETLTQLAHLLPWREIDTFLLDNMSLAQLRRAVATRDHTRTRRDCELEASGGVNLGTVRAIARTGVDRISVGALTHSAPALDLALDIE